MKRGRERRRRKMSRVRRRERRRRKMSRLRRRRRRKISRVGGGRGGGGR